jgi:DNA processing protein
MESREILPILALRQIRGIGQKSIEKILSRSDSFEPKSPKELLEILDDAHKTDKKIKAPDIKIIIEGWNKANEILEVSRKNDVTLISQKSPDYPAYLLKIPDPPVLLHVKGNVSAISRENTIAIVGTREPTGYGLNIARKLGRLFAGDGFVVVSGLAAGIDTSAHEGALDSGGLTAAVLAHGLHTVYPKENKKLADRIIEKNGALVSEYCWGMPSFRSSFVERDRIQSGLSLGVLVIETGTQGGTMHTARFCKNQNRALIVLNHPKEFFGRPEISGNVQLISGGKADLVFEEEGDLDLIKMKLDMIRKELDISGVKKHIQTTLF